MRVRSWYWVYLKSNVFAHCAAITGQKDILQALIAFARAKEADALERAREEDLDIVAEEEEEED